jgi:hypothetical protein
LAASSRAEDDGGFFLGAAGGTPPREALVAGFGRGVFQFEERTGQSVVVGFEQAELFN